MFSSTEGTGLRLITANLLYRWQRAGPFLKCVEAFEPDLLLLQELTPAVADELSRALGKSHPHSLLEPHEGADGFGVFARWALASVEEGAARDPADGTPEGDAQGSAGSFPDAGGTVAGRAPEAPVPGHELLARGNRFLQRSRLAAPWGSVDLFNTHLVSPVDADAISGVGLREVGRLREAQAWTIARALEGAGDAIVAGDFNAWPGRPAVRIVAEVARDSWVAGAGSGATWPRRVPWLSLHALPVFRLDYCFLSGRLRATSAQVYRVPTGSDHCPVVVEVST